MGYQGTLTPNPAGATATIAETDEAHRFAEFTLEPLLEQASQQLHLRLSAQRLNEAWKDVDLSALNDALRERLTGTLAQIMMAYPIATNEAIANQFPLLFPLLRSAITEWVKAIVVFHNRLRKDAARIAAWLGHPKLPDLASVIPFSSDRHEGGHTVLGLVFRDGRRIFYKPRPVTGEWLWDGLVQAVNTHSSLQLASAKALAGSNGRYGWVASLPPHERLEEWDRASAEAVRYWESAGATLCLAEHVRMTDLHMANVMATRFGPALFDAETLGTPRTVSVTPTRGRPQLPFATTIDDMLDTRLMPGQISEGLPDASGLFGKAAPVPDITIPRWSIGPGGRRYLEMAPAALADHRNAPPDASPLAVAPLLLRGYREAATALMRCRGSLMASSSAWRWTLEHEHASRVILRDTLTYGILLSRSLQPDSLQNAQRRRIALQSALSGVSDRTFPQSVLRAEVRSLLHLHIPRFTALPGSRTLAGNSGRRLAPRFLSCSPAESVMRKIGELSPDRLAEVQIPALLMVLFGQHA